MIKFLVPLLSLLMWSCLQSQSKPAAPGPRSTAAGYLDQRNRAAPLNASILVGNKDTVFLTRYFGFADKKANKAIDSSTLFPLASGTKPFTAAAILMLHDQDRLSIDDRLLKWLPRFPKTWERVTIKNLLSHTSGIPDWQKLAPDEKFPPTLYGFASVYKNIPLQSIPGNTYSYGNINYVLLSYLIEKVTGVPYERYMADSLIHPLSLQNTGFVYHYKGTRLAKPHNNAFKMDGTADAELVNYALLKGAGGMYSTTHDLSIFMSRLRDILKPQTFKLMIQPVKEDYGLGWHIQQQFGKTVIKHPGGVAGYCSEMRYVVEDDLTISILSNVRSNDLNIRYAAFDLLKLYNNQQPEVEFIPRKEYLGRFALPTDFAKKAGVGYVEVKEVQGAVVLSVPGKQESYLVPFAKGKYFFHGEASDAEFTEDGKELVILSPSFGRIVCKKLQ